MSATYVVFFPLFFLSDAVVPKQVLAGWFSAIATYNPVTYLLAALRSLESGGWRPVALVEGLGTVGRSSRAQPFVRAAGSQGTDPPGRVAGRTLEWDGGLATPA